MSILPFVQLFSDVASVDVSMPMVRDDDVQAPIPYACSAETV